MWLMRGKPLASHESCWWKVRVWDQDGKVSAWSTPARWTMGLLDAEDWTARWIGWDGGEETDDRSVVEGRLVDLVSGGQVHRSVRRSAPGTSAGRSNLPEGRRVRKAFLFATADDSFVAFVNGRSVGARPELGRGQALRRDRTAPAGAQHARRRRHEFAVPERRARQEPRRADRHSSRSNSTRASHSWSRPTRTGEPATRRSRAGNKTASMTPDGRKPSRSGALGTAPWGKLGGSNHRRLPARMLRREFQVAREAPSGHRLRLRPRLLRPAPERPAESATSS